MSLGLGPRTIVLLPDRLGLERGENALHLGIIPDITGLDPQAGDDIVHQSLEPPTGILGGFNQSSQRQEIEDCGHGRPKSIRASVTNSDARCLMGTTFSVTGPAICPIVCVIGGLGGRDFLPQEIRTILAAH